MNNHPCFYPIVSIRTPPLLTLLVVLTPVQPGEGDMFQVLDGKYPLIHTCLEAPFLNCLQLHSRPMDGFYIKLQLLHTSKIWPFSLPVGGGKLCRNVLKHFVNSLP